MADATLKPISGVLKALARGGLDAALARTADRLGRGLVADTQQLAPIDTGKLRRSIKILVKRPKYGRGPLMMVTGFAKYSAYVERRVGYMKASLNRNIDPISDALLEELEREVVGG